MGFLATPMTSLQSSFTANLNCPSPGLCALYRTHPNGFSFASYIHLSSPNRKFPNLGFSLTAGRFTIFTSLPLKKVLETVIQAWRDLLLPPPTRSALRWWQRSTLAFGAKSLVSWFQSFLRYLRFLRFVTNVFYSIHVQNWKAKSLIFLHEINLFLSPNENIWTMNNIVRKVCTYLVELMKGQCNLLLIYEVTLHAY